LKKKLPLFFVLLFTFVNLTLGHTQELVSDPCFEDFDPVKQKSNHWFSPKTNWLGKPRKNIHLFDENNHEKQEIYSSSQPQCGNSYSGVKTHGRLDQNRDYLSIRLSEPLKKDVRYKISFSIKLADSSYYAVSTFGALITNKHPKKLLKKKKYIQARPQLFHPPDSVIKGKRWHTIEGYYHAEGNEKYLTLGNFMPNNYIKTELLKTKQQDFYYNQKRMIGLPLPPLYQQSFYFVDGVSVTKHLDPADLTHYTSDLSCKEKTYALSDNLIHNPEFSETDNLAKYGGYKPVSIATHWYSPNRATPDYFTDEGGMAGLYTFNLAHPNRREYIGVRLKEELDPCKTYRFSMTFMRNATYAYASDKLGMALVDTLIFQKDKMILPLKATLETPDSMLITESDQWLSFCGDFSPKSCSNYLIIGNFNPDEKTGILRYDVHGGIFAYYLVKEVGLYQIAEDSSCASPCMMVDEIPEIAETTPETAIEFDGTTPDDIEQNTTTIQFDFDSYTLTKSDLKAIAQLMNQHDQSKIKHITVKGYSCDIGNEAYNLQLAQRRARAVIDAIKTQFAALDITFEEHHAVLDSKVKSESRKVEIIVGKTKQMF
jgi:outer membrane protein OmpA-like peptidoglycan-associated protein